MNPDGTPRRLNPRTDKHYCIKCRVEVSPEEYFGNDFLCNKCVESEGEFPLQSTEKEGMRDEG